MNEETQEVVAPPIVAAEPASEREVAYTIKDAFLPRFTIYKSHNAWWMDTTKLKRIIYKLKEGRLVKEALLFAGVTKGQWEYFKEVHPGFDVVIDTCEMLSYDPAFKSMNAGIKKDPNLAFRVLSKTHEKFKQKEVEPLAPLQPTIPTVAVQNNINIDAGEISKALRDITREVFGSDEENTDAIVNETMEGFSQEGLQ